MIIRLNHRRSRGHEHPSNLSQADRDLWLEIGHLSYEVLREEELSEIQLAARIQVLAVDVHEERRVQLQAGALEDVGLNSQVVEMLLLHLGCGLDLDHSPPIAADPLDDVCPHENVVELNERLKDGWNTRR